MNNSLLIKTLLAVGSSHLLENDKVSSAEIDRVFEPLLNYINKSPDFSIEYTICETVIHMLQEYQRMIVKEINSNVAGHQMAN